MEEFITTGKINFHNNNDQYKKEGIIENKKYKIKMVDNDELISKGIYWYVLKNGKWTPLPPLASVSVKIFYIFLNKDCRQYKKGNKVSVWLSYDKKYFSIGIGRVYEVKKHGRIVNEK